MGAGLLPITLYKGEIFILLGQEVEDNLWSDFGGGREKGEKIIQTAIREGCEELNGLLGCEKDLFQRVKANYIDTIIYEGFHSILFFIDYDDKLPNYFENLHKFIERKIPNKISKNGLFEKRKIKWFSKNELQKRIKQIRPFYRNIIHNFLLNFHTYKKILKLKY